MLFHIRRLRRLCRVLDLQNRKRVGVRVRFDAHRLMQRRSRQPTGQCTRSIVASATRSSSVCGRPWPTRSCRVYTHFIALVTYSSTNHLQTVYTMMHSVFHGLAPVYNIQHCYFSYTSPGPCSLTISKYGDYNTPLVFSSFGQRLFSVSGPDAWNSLSRELRGIAVASTFKRHLKAELFSRAYGVSLADSSVTVYS